MVSATKGEKRKKMVKRKGRGVFSNLFGGKKALSAYTTTGREGNNAVLNSGQRRVGNVTVSLHGVKPIMMLYKAPVGEEGMMLTYLYKLIQKCTDILEATGMIISYISTYFPTYYERLREALDGYFFTIEEITYPNSPIFNGHETQEVESNQVLLGMLGIFMHIPFKNITKENFSQFFSARAAEICDFVCLTPGQLPLPAIGYIVRGVKNVMTSMGAYRRLVVQIMMDAQTIANEAIRSVVYYVIGMTQHTEMAAFFFVEQALINTVSPILFFPELRTEVKNYCDAMEVVASVTYPAFFCIVSDPAFLHYVDRNRFPTLVAVSTQILAMRYPSMRFFTGLENINAARLKVLISSHKRFMLHGQRGMTMEEFDNQATKKIRIRGSSKKYRRKEESSDNESDEEC